jgi:preprotein translocase subunit SecE
MSTQIEVSSNKSFNIIKWIVAILLLVGATLAPRYMESWAALARWSVIVAIVIAAFAFVLWTEQGKSFLQLLQDARGEMRRIVWPTRQEATMTTLMVFVIVFVAAMILWGFDSLFAWLISLIIGK